MRKKIKLKRKNSFLEAEEILFNEPASEQADFSAGAWRLEAPIEKWGARLALWLALAFFIISLGIIFNFNIIRGKEFQEKALSNSLKYTPILAKRGMIYDRFGNILAKNISSFDLVFFFSQTSQDPWEREKIKEKIKNYLGWTEEKFQEEISCQSRFSSRIILKENLSLTESAAAESYFADIPSVGVAEKNQREYAGSFSFSHILGYLGAPSADDLEKDREISVFSKIGKSGLEAVYENYLRGKDGRVVVSKNAGLEILGQSDDREPERGNDLYLSLDLDLQKYLYERLKKQAEGIDNQKRGALAIVLNSRTGEILSLASYPSFDINNLSLGIEEKELKKIVDSSGNPFFNRAVSGLYSPGSTIKPLIAAAALEEKIISPAKKIQTSGSISIANPWDPEHPSVFVDWKNQGAVDMYSALAKSSNVYFYYLGGGFKEFKGLGIEKISRYLKNFKFDQITEIDLLGEEKGFVPDEKNNSKDAWRIGDTYNTSIGQGDVLTTPLRLLVSLNSLASGGAVEPHLGTEIKNPEGQIIWQKNAEPQKVDFIDGKNIEEVRKGMIDVVAKDYGTGYMLASLPFSAGGKSGTTQTFGKKYLNALFFAFAPAKNPEISMLVLIEKAKEGALNAIPVAFDTLNWYFENRGFKD